VVYTWWCWHTLRRKWRLKGREGLGSSAGFDAFEKMKCIVSIVSEEKLEKSRGR